MNTTFVLLHGANGSAEAIKPLARALQPYAAKLALPNLLGHGGRRLVRELSIPAMAHDLLAQLDRKDIGRAAFVGYSLGGYLGLYLAWHHPDRVAALCTIATPWVLDEAAIDHLLVLADPERIARKNPPRPAQLAREHHPQDWRQVLQQNRQMFAALRGQVLLPEEALQSMRVPALVVSGTGDPLVSRAESERLGQLLSCDVLLFPGPAHPLDVVPLQTIAGTLGHWLQQPRPLAELQDGSNG